MTINVLYVEDQPLHAQMLLKVMKDKFPEASFEHVKSYQGAVNKLGEKNFSLLITDGNILKEEAGTEGSADFGYDLCAYVDENEKFKHMKVLLLTSSPAYYFHKQVPRARLLSKCAKDDPGFAIFMNVLSETIKSLSESINADPVSIGLGRDNIAHVH